MKKLIKSVKDDDFDTCLHRVIIRQDQCPCDPLREWDHPFEMWGNHRRYDFSTKNAENPFEEDREDGDTLVVRDGFVVFSVNLYDHSGLAFSLGGDPANGFDPGGWDTTTGAAYIYFTKETYESMCGKGTWKGTEDEEFRAELEKIAEGCIEELNLVERGMVFGYEEEIGTPVGTRIERTYPDGRVDVQTTKDIEYEDGDSCWGFLTGKADEIDFPRGPDIEVFDATECFAGDEYTIPEFVIRVPNADGGYTYLTDRPVIANGKKIPGAYEWSAERSDAAVFYSWWKVQSVAQDVIPRDQYNHERNIERIDEHE